MGINLANQKLTDGLINILMYFSLEFSRPEVPD